jgi:hypothetical protein
MNEETKDILGFLYVLGFFTMNGLLLYIGGTILNNSVENYGLVFGVADVIYLLMIIPLFGGFTQLRNYEE